MPLAHVNSPSSPSAVTSSLSSGITLAGWSVSPVRVIPERRGCCQRVLLSVDREAVAAPPKLVLIRAGRQLGSTCTPGHVALAVALARGCDQLGLLSVDREAVAAPRPLGWKHSHSDAHQLMSRWQGNCL